MNNRVAEGELRGRSFGGLAILVRISDTVALRKVSSSSVTRVLGCTASLRDIPTVLFTVCMPFNSARDPDALVGYLDCLDPLSRRSYRQVARRNERHRGR